MGDGCCAWTPLWRRVLLCLMWGWACAAGAGEVTEVQRTAWRDGQVIASATVTLPDRLPREWLNDQVRVVYRWHYSGLTAQGRPESLWLLRAGAPYRLHINGAPAHRLLPLPELMPAHAPVFNGRSPALFALPPGDADIELSFQTRPFMQQGLVQLHQGPADALALRHVQEYARLATPVFVTVVLSATLFFIALALWMARPVEHLLLGLFAGLCAAMALRHWLAYWSDIDLPPLLYEHLNPYLIYCFDLLALAISWRLAGLLSRRRVQWLWLAWVLFTLVSVLAVAAPWGTLALRDFVQLTGLGALLYIVAFTVSQRRRLQPSWTWSIATGYLLLLLGALHDLGLVTGHTPPNHGTMIVWGFAAVVLAYAYVTADVVLRELQRARSAGAELEQRVQRAREELERSYAALALHERREAARQERSTLMRELHDSLGAQLMTALRGVERDALSKADLLAALQDGLSNLRQLLSTHSADGRLVGALANWRQHWHERLAQAGVTVAWDMDASVDEVVLPPESLHQILRILQECATNTLKHAGADRFNVRVQRRGETIQLSFCDNGHGFPTPVRTDGEGHGLRSMSDRASQIGARLHLGNGPAPWGACVELELPLSGPDPSGSP